MTFLNLIKLKMIKILIAPGTQEIIKNDIFNSI